jgi:hypothetical protein
MENNNNKIIQKIIQAGAVGLCILLIALVGYIFNKYDKLATNHSTEFTAAIKENTGVLIDLKNFLMYQQPMMASPSDELLSPKK